jgi:hypothetical protein
MYQDIVFLQNEEANEALNILKNKGQDSCMNFLSQWDYGDSPYIEDNPIGLSDTTYEKDNYIMHYNTSIEYIGLIKKVSND